ncbi:nuclear transcription factor Y subunit beta [Eurosta solidaginis]|uniref:nuclear transcription factor Y subunit beta n=1 Tax=Eurosta solidaginis TaxID=178769 RepID=UPI0035305790
MAFSRLNIEKRRLIELVRLNPILWDCRLPHYKRSDKKKALKWNELGRVFGVSGERVQRTFTSLREIFRRELNHEKMLGERFKSKWEYYDTMAFLKEVIRERKSRERNKNSTDAQQQQQQQQPQHSNNNSSAIDEYQYFAPNDPNNPNNQKPPTPEHMNEKQKQQQNNQQQLHMVSFPLPLPQLNEQQQQTHTPIPNAMATQPQQQELQQQHQQHNMPPDVVLSLNTSAITPLSAVNARPPSQSQQQQQASLQPLHLQQQQFAATQSQQHPPPTPDTQAPIAISSSRSSSSSPSIYIKDEPDTPDTLSLNTITINDHNSTYSTRDRRELRVKDKRVSELIKPKAVNNNNHNNNNNNNHNKNNTDVIYKSKAYNIPHSSGSLIIDEQLAEPDVDLDDLDDPDIDMLDDDARLSPASTYTLGTGAAGVKESHPTAREVLYTKFGDFLAARLNTLNETVANDLMNRILMLIAEK